MDAHPTESRYVIKLDARDPTSLVGEALTPGLAGECELCFTCNSEWRLTGQDIDLRICEHCAVIAKEVGGLSTLLTFVDIDIAKWARVVEFLKLLRGSIDPDGKVVFVQPITT